MSCKVTGELYVMTVKNGVKFDEELIYHREFDEFWHEHLKTSKICTLMGCFNVWDKKSTEELCLMALKTDTKFEGKLTCAL